MTPQARPARKADIRELSRTMSLAFFDDPVMSWVLPDDNARSAQLVGMFSAMTRHHHLTGGGVEVSCDGPGVGAAALWDPPNRWQHSRLEELAMMPSFIRVFGLRSAKAQALQELMKRSHPDEPHWYLAATQADELVDATDFPEEGGPGQTLNASEGTDSDELHNDDGDIVVDPPEGWSEANRFGMTAREEREGESLDDRLAEEEPDVAREPDETTGSLGDDPPGRAHRGQIDGAPEDGESLYEVVDENGAPDFTQTTE